MRNLLVLISTFIMLATAPTTSSNAQDHTFTGDGTLRRIHVPILMYHYVSELPPDADPIRTELTLHPELFRQHIAYLAENGYSTISLYDLDSALERGTRLPPKPVVLTFDDGYIDAYTEVFPILMNYNMTATFFIITQFADDNRPGYMNWEQITEMARAGMHMEGHSKTHPTLDGRDYDFLVYQVVGSLESLEAHTGNQPGMFSYPVGRYDDETLTFMQTTTIERAVTTQTGTYHTTGNRLELARMRITNETGVPALAYLLNYGK